MNSSISTSPTALASWMRGLGTCLEKMGHDPTPIFAQQGLDYSLTTQSEARFPVQATTRVWHEAVRLTQDEGLGLKAIRFIAPSNFHFLGMGILASQNIREVCQRLTRFSDLLSDASSLAAQDLPDGLFELTISIKPGCEPAWQSTDGLVGLLANGGKGLGAPQLRPEWVELKRPMPADPAVCQEFDRVYDCEVRFDQPSFRLVFTQATVDQPLGGSNPGLAAHLDEASSQAVAKLRPKPTLQSKLTQWLQTRLQTGQSTSIDDAARAMNMSSRNIQRKLADEGASFNAMLESTRRTLAETALKSTTLPLTHIAMDLGFADVSSFSRACKRWFGKSPSQLRN